MKYHECLADKLNGSKTAPKTYWAILKTFVNGSKIPLIPPLLVDDKLLTDFLDKANLFNNFFAKQCTPISNDSTVPENINFETRERLSSLEFCVDDIVKIIRSLDQNKAHGHETESFPKEWKKANIIPVYKKSDKQLIINYRPVLLVPIWGKVFEKIICNSLFCNQFGFRPGDSWVNQLISITHDIYKAFDANLVRSERSFSRYVQSI